MNLKSKYTLWALAGCAVLAALYYALTHYGFLGSGSREAASAEQAYLLYTAQEKKQEVTLFLGDALTDGFKARKAEIFLSDNPINRIKQVVIMLLDKAPDGYVSLIPEGTMLREAYLDPNGIVYIDLSEEFIVNHKGGTTAEYMTVYSLVNSVMYNFPDVRGVRLLCDGKEFKTITGHILTEGILTPDSEFKAINPR